MSISRNVRIGTVKPCRQRGCGAMVLTKASPKRCPSCRRMVLQARMATYRASLTQPQVREPQPCLETPEAIDRLFTQALAVIRRTPRPDPLVRWESPLARIQQ